MVSSQWSSTHLISSFKYLQSLIAVKQQISPINNSKRAKVFLTTISDCIWMGFSRSGVNVSHQSWRWPDCWRLTALQVASSVFFPSLSSFCRFASLSSSCSSSVSRSRFFLLACTSLWCFFISSARPMKEWYQVFLLWSPMRHFLPKSWSILCIQ